MAEQAWHERYPSKVASAEKAVRSVPRGRRILIGSGAAEPSRLVEALITHGDHLADNDIVHLLTLGKAPYVEPGLERRFRHTALFIGPNVRQAVQEVRADLIERPVALPPPREQSGSTTVPTTWLALLLEPLTRVAANSRFAGM